MIFKKYQMIIYDLFVTPLWRESERKVKKVAGPKKSFFLYRGAYYLWRGEREKKNISRLLLLYIWEESENIIIVEREEK